MKPDQRRFAVEFWGVAFAVEWTEAQFDECMLELLLPNWVDRPDLETESVFRLFRDSSGELRVEAPAEAPTRVSKPSIVDTLERRLQLFLGSTTREAVFVHAGVVAWKGGALVVPGRSYTGKSSLTHALLRAGATYLSDEYAIIDPQGQVHAFPRRLSLRLEGGQTERVDAAAEGFPIGEGPLPLKAVLDCPYEKAAVWQPKPLSRGEGVLKMLANTVSAQAAPELAMRCLSRGVENAQCFQSPRGEADLAAAKILEHFG